MGVSNTTRFQLTRWSEGSDPPVTRSQLDGDNASVDQLAAGFLIDVIASRPTADAAHAGFFYLASDTGAVSFCDGTTWLPIPVGAFLLLAGGTLSGNLNLATHELQNPTVLHARDKRFTANVTGSTAIDSANGPNQTLTATGNVTISGVSNMSDGEALRIGLWQDATGSRTFTFPSSWIWPQGSVPTLKTTANARNTLFLDKIGSDYEAFLATDQKTP